MKPTLSRQRIHRSSAGPVSGRSWFALANAIVEGALIGGPREKVGQFLERWLDAVASQRVRPRTFERYRGVVSNHLSPELGDLPLPKLTPQHIERLYVAKRGELSPAGVRYIHQVLHAALAHAARMRMIPYNPAEVWRRRDPPSGRCST